MAWTGEKRRKSTRPSPLGSFGNDADMMDIEEEQGRNGGGRKHPPEEHEGEDTGSVVYSVNDEFSKEDLAPYLNKVKSRKPPILSSFEHHPVLSEEEVEKLLVRFCNLRFREYCEQINEYCWWDDYSSTFSNYETDVDYVMYFDALSKKIKWIEEYLDLNSKEFDICKDKIPNHAVEDGEVLKNITFAIHKLTGEKDFLDFTIKKLKIAQRLQLTPSPYGFCGFYL
ncbi:unnamed protein product [Miscanthus lutarioriparius]|uniref:Uncharacterized protein n=1 Tax=Miscanthus lutarioriparius TaxID=422564 RepID=A0A811PII7_9POAL|nr:unnamed protein product [Miscanthus lutarioriparius]